MYKICENLTKLYQFYSNVVCFFMFIEFNAESETSIINLIFSHADAAFIIMVLCKFKEILTKCIN